MRVNPAFEVDLSSLSTEELKRRLSNNCPSVTYIDLCPDDSSSTRYDSSLVKALSRNNQVKDVYLDLDFFGVDPETIRALVNWLVTRGDKCDLSLYLGFWNSADLRLLERMVAFLSPSRTSLNVTGVEITDKQGLLSNVGPSCVINMLSLLSKNTSLELREAEVRNSLVPHFHHVAELQSLSFYHDLLGPFDHFLSHQNIRRLYISIQVWPVLGAVVDGLVMHHSQDGTRLNEVFLHLYSGIRGGRLAEALSRIPQRLSLDIQLDSFDDDDEETHRILEGMQSVSCLRKVELAVTGIGSGCISGLEELCHGRIEEFMLHTARKRLETPICLKAFHSSDLVTLNFYLEDIDESVEIDVVEGLAKVVPTMGSLKHLMVETHNHSNSRRSIWNKQEHDEYMASSDRDSIYVAYDTLVETVCRLPLITSK